MTDVSIRFRKGNHGWRELFQCLKERIMTNTEMYVKTNLNPIRSLANVGS